MDADAGQLVTEQLVMVTTLVPVMVSVVIAGDGVGIGVQVGLGVVGLGVEWCLDLLLDMELIMEEAMVTGQTVVKTLTVAVT